MRKMSVAFCLLLACGSQPIVAGQFAYYKVCHGEKREVCNQHPEFDHFEGCTNSTNGGQGEARPEYTCEQMCGISAAHPGLCAVVPPRYELNAGHKCSYAWFMVKCQRLQ
jgi:hypothetical protein